MRVTGPIRSYFIATMVRGDDHGNFVGHAKVCKTRPDGFDQARALFQVTTPQAAATPDEARMNAFRAAKKSLDDIRS